MDLSVDKDLEVKLNDVEQHASFAINKSLELLWGHTVVSRLSLFTGAFGTLVWAYGDLFLEVLS